MLFERLEPLKEQAQAAAEQEDWDDDAYQIRPDGTGLTQLTSLAAAGDWLEDSGQWTPDGK